ncbi:MAG: Penicillin-binding protein 2, partial [Berkelbacteria bacterium GW2011_GWA2_35_9]
MKRKFYKPNNFDKIESNSHEFSVEIKPLDQQPIINNPASTGLIRWYLLTCIVFVIILFRLSYLQITEGKINQRLAEGNRIRLQEITAPRGNFYDREGNLLSLNVAQSNLVIYPLEISKNYQDKLVILNKISEVCDLDFVDVAKNVLKINSVEPIIIKPKLDHQESLNLQIKIKGITGIEVENIPIKKYQNIPGIGHILGYIGKVSEEDLKTDKTLSYTDLVGKSGLEKTYNSDLRGKNGFKKNEVNSRGVLQRMISQKYPEIGSDLYLSISSKLQIKANELLKKTLEEKKLSKGVVIVSNPQTGKILSMLSLPDFDANLMQESKDEIDKIFSDSNNPLLNRAIAGQYPSGSSIKPIIAASALQENIVNSSYAVDTPSEITIGDSTFPDWKDHGMTDIERAIAESNNIFFYMLGGGWKNIRGLGVEGIEKYLKLFGFGNDTGIDLTG